MFNDGIIVNIIRRARKEAYTTLVHASEIGYVMDHSELNQHDKLVWIKLASLTAFKDDLTYAINLGNIAKLLSMSKEEVLDALMRLQDKEFLRLGLDIRVNVLGEINHLLRNGDRTEEVVSKIQSIHCQLLLPRLGLMALLTKPDNHLDIMIDEYKNNLVAAV